MQPVLKDISRARQPFVANGYAGKSAIRKLEKSINAFLQKNPDLALERYIHSTGKSYWPPYQMQVDLGRRAEKFEDLQSFEPKYLDTHHDKEEITALLSVLPPQTLDKEFGRDVFFWTWINSLFIHGYREEAMDYLTSTGMDGTLFEKARRNFWENTIKHMCDFEGVTRFYKLLVELKDRLSDLNIAQFVGKNSVGMQKEKIGNYSVEILETLDANLANLGRKWNAPPYKIHMDAPVGIALLYGGAPCAAVAFQPTDKGTMLINQIQRIKEQLGGESREKPRYIGNGLARAGLDWRKFLVDTCIFTIRQFNYTRIGIQGAMNNEWREQTYWNGDLHVTFEQLLKNYDKVAKRLGFSQEKDGNYYKPLEK